MTLTSDNVVLSKRTTIMEQLRSVDKREQQAAWKQVIKDVLPSISYFTRQNGGTEEDAKDIFHESLAILVEKSRMPEFELTSAIKTYIYSICRNLWYNRLRKLKPMSDIRDTEEVADAHL